MSDHYEDPELERQLDTAFAQSRARRGFDDELWARLQARRSGRWSLAGAFRRVDVVAALTVVSVLTVVVGLGFVFVTGHHGASSSSSAAGSTASGASGPIVRGQAGGVQQAAAPLGPDAFGRVPAVPPRVSTDYTGGLDLKLVASLPALPGTLPVYRYTEPSSSSAGDFARSLGAAAPVPAAPVPATAAPTQAQPAAPPTEAQQGAAGGGQRILGEFSGAGNQVIILGSDQQALVGPTFVLSPTAAARSSPDGAAPAGGLSDSQAQADASRFLDQNNLRVPGTPAVRNSGASGAQVVYASQLKAGDAGMVPQVDGRGRPVVTQVGLRADGTVFQASGPLTLTSSQSGYPTATAAGVQDAVRSLARPGAGAVANLDTARLVYVAVPDAGGGYFEPAILLTGSATSGGASHQVSVLVPAVDPSQTR